MKINRKTGGFTIIELLVVIVVIAILVALTLPNLFGLQRRARDDTRKNDLKNVQQSLETFYNDNNRYPAQLTDLVSDYINTVPADPRGGAYTYAPAGACPADCTTYDLSADLENDSDPAAQNGIYTITSVNQE